MLKTRWFKILNDVWGNKTRSLLVILSIAVGVGVVGIINNARYMIEDDLYSQYAAGNPASVSLYVSPFQEDLLDEIKTTDEVESVEARRLVQASILRGDQPPSEVVLAAVPNIVNTDVNQLTFLEGRSTLGDSEIVLEKQTAEALGAQVGDQISVQMENGETFSLTVSAIAQNIYDMPYSISSRMSGFVTMDTLVLMGEMPYYNRLDVVVAEPLNTRDGVLDVGAKLRDEIIQPAGVFVGSIQIPGIDSDPGEHWAQNQISGFVLILQVMSVLAIFLSGGLVINTISAILTQQVKQIGIMRSIGAVPGQISGMFILNILIFSLLGWLVAIPISLLGSYGLASFAANYLNFNVSGMHLSPEIFVLMTAIAFIVPVGVALIPIIKGTSIKIYDAIYQQGLVNEDQKPWLERALGRLKFLSPASVLSLLNTFRNVPRLTITLITLILAGATFVAAFSTRASLNAQIDEFSRYAQFDAAIEISDQQATRDEVEAAALDVPGVVVAEGWVDAGGIFLRSDGSEGGEVELIGLPSDTQTIDPVLLSGRWLTDADKTGVVVNQDLVQQEDGIELGGQITVQVMGKDHTYDVVGIASKHLVGPRVYMNSAAFADLTGVENQVSVVRVRTSLDEIGDSETQAAVGTALEDSFKELGYADGSAQLQSDFSEYLSEPFSIILMVLLVMAGLLAVVGGLSLAGTMGINVMERTREIGVLRSVGASNGAIRQVVVLEGVVIAVLSWMLVGVVSGPSAAALASAVMYAILKVQLTFSYSFAGLFIWLAIIVAIGALSSLTPARNAVRLTVREVLDYE
jgi:putative ABC transport system permease protein